MALTIYRRNINIKNRLSMINIDIPNTLLGKVPFGNLLDARL
jgi:hypothetical protein